MIQLAKRANAVLSRRGAVYCLITLPTRSDAGITHEASRRKCDIELLFREDGHQSGLRPMIIEDISDV